jgi:DNA invertase Pin-like site-specific DNA recombinase
MITMTKTAYYLRTSHYLQNINRQEEKIQPGWLVYKDEGVSGAVAFEDRPQGRKLMSDVKKGLIKELRVDTLDRLGRNTQNVLQTISFMHEHKVGIHIKKEGIVTLVDGKENYVTSLLTTILLAVSQMELMRIRERSLEGIALGKRRGVYKGRKPGAVTPLEKLMQKPKVRKIKLMLEEGIAVRKICEVVECSPNYISKIKERLGSHAA